MKRYVFQVAALLAAVLFVVSCSKEIKNSNEDSGKKLSFSAYKQYGDLHNAFLSNALDHFSEDISLNLKQDKIDYVARFQQGYVPSTGLSANDQNQLSAELYEYRDLVVYPDLYNEAFVSRGSGVTLSSEIDDLLANGVIDAFEHGKLKTLLSMARGNLDGTVSNTQLEDFVQRALKDWENSNYTQNSATGQLLPIVLSISLSSIDWWKTHPSADKYKTAALPAWAAADVAGGIVGAVSSGIVQYTITGDVNWKVVGGSAVAGAVVGSTGLVGRIAKWFS